MNEGSNGVEATSQLEPLRRRTVFIRAWCLLIVVVLLPLVVVSWRETQFGAIVFLLFGIAAITTLVLQSLLLWGWPRRLWSLLLAAFAFLVLVVAIFEGTFGLPYRMYVTAVGFPLLGVCSILLVRRSNHWRRTAAILLAIAVVVLLIGRYVVTMGGVPSTVHHLGDVVHDYPIWFGTGEDAVVGSILLSHPGHRSEGSNRPDILQTVGTEIRQVELPQGLWLPSRPWGTKIAYGSSHPMRNPQKQVRETRVRIVDIDGTVEVVENTPPSPAAVGPMIEGWVHGSSDSPWRLIPIADAGQSYDSGTSSVLARNSQTGEERLIPDFYASHFGKWRDANTVVYVSTVILHDPSKGRASDINRLRLMERDLQDDEEIILKELMLPDLGWILHVSGGERVVFNRGNGYGLGMVDWGDGEVRTIAERYRERSLGVFDTKRGLRLVFEQIDPTTKQSHLRVHDGDAVIASLETTGTSMIRDPFVSPDGTKVLFLRQTENKWYGGVLAQHTYEVWDLDRDHVTILQHTPLVAGVLQELSLIHQFQWNRNPWSPDSRTVAVREFKFRLLPNAAMFTHLHLFHYEDWAEEKWGARPE
jgi:hypothetical protein